MLTVFEIAPEMNGCTAPIILMCPLELIERLPLSGVNAQSNTDRCSSRRSGAPSIVSCSSTNWTMASTCSCEYPSLRSARGTVLLTSLMTPPPTSFLYLTSAMSGSTPVVSQSIMKPMVPVGASTVAWELRMPCTGPRSATLRHALRAASNRPPSGTSCSLISSTARRCIRMTPCIGCALTEYPSNGPMRSDSRVDISYARPVMSDVTAPA